MTEGKRDSKRPSTAPPPPSRQPDDPTLIEDERWMDLALVHAKSGRPSPNPHVGAVIVKDGELVYFMERHQIEGRYPEEIAAELRAAYAEHC